MDSNVLLELLNKYVRAELIILIPVLSILSKIIDKSNIDNKTIPMIISLAGIILTGIYIFSTLSIENWQEVLFAIFTSITQGILLAGGAIWSGIMYRQCTTGKCKNNKLDK